MVKHVFIAGHGKNLGGSWDPGAAGNGKTEADFIRKELFREMKKFAPTNVEFVEDHNVYSHGTLSRYKGSIVTEFHLDAFTSSATGGHVIVWHEFAPDKQDLAIRDVLKKWFGVRYTHKGHTGISGRADLANPRISNQSNINYRLVELCFITSKRDMDILKKNLTTIAKELVKAICGTVKESKKTYTVKSGDSLWKIANSNNTTVSKLQKDNDIKNTSLIHPGQVLTL